jgi:hypothetical protein
LGAYFAPIGLPFVVSYKIAGNCGGSQMDAILVGSKSV